MDRHVRGESVATPASAMLLKTFLLSISPIDLEAFVAANYFWKVYEIFKVSWISVLGCCVILLVGTFSSLPSFCIQD